MIECGNNPSAPGPNPAFQTTHWSVVLQASSGDSTLALENLCRTYWYPLYVYIRRQGYDVTDAQDLTQGFFEVFLAKHYLKDVDRDKGRFRSFLLASLKHYLVNEWKKANRQKRGGLVETISFDGAEAEERFRLEPVEEFSADQIFDRRWAKAVLDSVTTKLRAEFAETGKADRFESMSRFIFQEPSPGEYAQLAGQWRISESGVRSSVQRVRQRYAALFRKEIAQTVNDPRDVEGEIAYLLAALGK